jgi:sugar phosphate isomerase/epimerase
MAALSLNTFNRSAWHGVDPDLPGQIRAAAEAGFPMIGPDRFSLDHWTGNGRSLAELRRLIDRAGLRCSEIAAAFDLVPSREETLAGARHALTLADALGTPFVQTNSHLPVSPESCDLFAECARIVKPSGAKLAMEYLPFTPINNIATARALVEHAGIGNSGIVVDSWHHWRGTDRAAELKALPADRIAYVQFDDALPMVGDDIVQETIHRRTFPGDGEFDLEGFCAPLKANGFDGIVSVEVLSLDWRERGDLGEFARRAYAGSRRYWG